jgi:hypothetical protein
MEITNKIVESYKFKRINNSMWRRDEMTLQNAYTHRGDNIYEKILNTKKAYKACYKGKFVAMIETEMGLHHLVYMYFERGADMEIKTYVIFSETDSKVIQAKNIASAICKYGLICDDINKEIVAIIELERGVEFLKQFSSMIQANELLPRVIKMQLLSDDQLRILNDTYNRLLGEEPTKL